MTEIKKIKTTIDCAVTDFRAQLAFGGEIVLTKAEITSLLTTIESLQTEYAYERANHNAHVTELCESEKLVQSQKEEIEKLNNAVNFKNHVIASLENDRELKNKRESDLLVEIIDKDVLIESLKAITELKNAEIAELRDREFNHYPIVILDLETRIFKLQDAVNESHTALKWAVEYHIKTCTCPECNALGVVEKLQK